MVIDKTGLGETRIGKAGIGETGLGKQNKAK